MELKSQLPNSVLETTPKPFQIPTIVSHIPNKVGNLGSVGRPRSSQYRRWQANQFLVCGPTEPSIMLQHGIPAHIAESARCLFRECMRRADYVGNQHGNKGVLRSLVREQFRRNMHETDPIKIDEQKQAATRVLFNHMYYEASRMATEQGEDELITESLLGLPKPALGMTLQDEDNKASR